MSEFCWDEAEARLVMKSTGQTFCKETIPSALDCGDARGSLRCIVSHSLTAA